LIRAATAAVIAAALLAGGAYLGSPFYTAWQLRAAARSGDRDRLEQLVDFPQVREHLKSQVENRLLEALRKDPKLNHGSLAAFGALLAPALTDRIIDSVVTADGIATVIRYGKVDHAGGRSGSGTDAEGHTSAAKPHLHVSSSYKDLDHVAMTIRDTDDSRHLAAVVTLSRTGLFSWRATRIDLPALLDDAQAAAIAK
jgi:hypothetical protein